MPGSPTKAAAAWCPEKRSLFRYIVVVATLAFCNRSLPTSFLPLVLSKEFGQPAAAIGVALSAYPAAALLVSGWATRVAIASRSVFRLHSTSLMWMAVATFMFGLAELSLPVLGSSGAMSVVIVLRLLQGTTAAMYLSSNTTLITRHFGCSVPYVLGMVEVGVGVGSQLGRLLGGFLYDWGGFWCPFVTLAAAQTGWGLLGLCMYQELPCSASTVVEKKLASVHFSSFRTSTNAVALMAVLFNYFIIGFMDETLPAHLERHIGPLPISAISVLLSIRSLTYLLVSYGCAQAMHRSWISLEAMIAIGSACCVAGLLLMGPVGVVREAAAGLAQDQWQLSKATWAIQILSLVVVPIGLASTFIPALPLLQREVRHLGDQAVEQVAQLFIAAMSLGEAIGPIAGGALSAQVGFTRAATFCAAPMVLVLVGSLLVLARRPPEVAPQPGTPTPLLHSEDISSPFVAANLDEDEESEHFWALDLVDGESAFRVRQMTYMMRQEAGPPGSAPSLTFRRQFSPTARKSKHKPWDSAPSSTFRRLYKR